MTPTGNAIPPSAVPVEAKDANREGEPQVDAAVRRRGPANPIRVSVGRELGRTIDGAWWPRADRITNELPGLVALLTPLLGGIASINVNWPPLQRPPDFNWPGWENRRQHVMTVIGADARVNLLIIPYTTYSALAVMVLRCAAGLPVESRDMGKPVFITAGSILRAAQQQLAAGCL
jgi:hypothetical protein